MTNNSLVLQQMLILLAMMAAGFLCYRKNWLDRNSYQKLSNIVVNILNPMIIINGVVNKSGGEDMKKVILNIGLCALYFLILLAAGLVTDKILRVKGEQKYLYRMMMVFSNVGFIPIPLLSGIYGQDVVFYIAFYVLGYNILLYTYGIRLLSGSRADGEKTPFSFKKMCNPGVAACLVAVAVFAFRIPVPESVKTFTSYMGNAAIPMSMMLTGASIAQVNMRELLRDGRVYLFLALKLLVIPIAAALVIRRFSLPEELAGTFVFILAMPVGSIVVPMAAEQGADEKCCTRGTVLSTLFSILTVPLVSLFL